MLDHRILLSICFDGLNKTGPRTSIIRVARPSVAIIGGTCGIRLKFKVAVGPLKSKFPRIPCRGQGNYHGDIYCTYPPPYISSLEGARPELGQGLEVPPDRPVLSARLGLGFS